MDALAVEYIAVHDRPPIEVPHGKGCACWAAIARQIALGLFPLRLQPQLDERWIKSVCEASQSFSMEASVCLPCGVPQKWSGLELGNSVDAVRTQDERSELFVLLRGPRRSSRRPFHFPFAFGPRSATRGDNLFRLFRP